MVIIEKIKGFFKKAKNNRPTIFIIGTFIGIVITMFLTPILQPYFAQYDIFTFLDNESPKFISISPNINERLNESPEEIKISFKEDGGSRIDKEASKIMLRGATTGNVKEKSIEYNENMIIFTPNETLNSDAYTIEIEICDNGGNIAFNTYSFYVLENPELVIRVEELVGQVKEWWSERLNMSYEQYNYYLLLLSNQNNVFLENVVFEIQFPGIIIDYEVQEDIGNFGYYVDKDKGNIFVGVETENITSCCSDIYIKEIAPGGDLLVVFYVDLEIEKYDNAFWCRPGIFDSSYILTSNFENEYKVSYYYQEYNYWYYNSSTGNISQFDID